MTPEEAMETLATDKRSNKPLMEKRRRARINASLAELKALLIDFMKTEGTRHSKMEKADILEMTVRHLRQLQRQQYSGSTETNPMAKFHAGYNECASQLSDVLSNMGGRDDLELRTRLLTHLANTLHAQNTSTGADCSIQSSSLQSIMPRTMGHVNTCMTSPSSSQSSAPPMKMIKLDINQSSHEQYLNQRVAESNPIDIDTAYRHKLSSKRELHVELSGNSCFQKQSIQTTTLGDQSTLAPLPAPRVSTPSHPLTIQTMSQGVHVMSPAQNGNVAIVIPSNFLNGTNCFSIPLYTTFANNGPVLHSSPKRADTIDVTPMDTLTPIGAQGNKLDSEIVVSSNTSSMEKKLPVPTEGIEKMPYDSDMWRPW